MTTTQPSEQVTLTALICRMAVDIHVSPADLIALPGFTLRTLLDEWQAAAKRAARAAAGSG